MIPLHYLWAKSNNKMHGQIWMWHDLVLFLFWFRSFTWARCGFCSIVCLRFQVVQIKQADYKISTKNVNNYKQKTCRDVFGQLHTQEHKVTKKQIVRVQLNKNKSKEKQTRLMSWYWKRKPTWRKDLTTYNNHPWIMFSFNRLVIIWRGILVLLKTSLIVPTK